MNSSKNNLDLIKKCCIHYQINDEQKKIEFFICKGYSDKEITIEIISSTTSKGDQLEVILTPHKDIILNDFFIEYGITYSTDDKVFVNGYQSWTTSKEFGLDEKRKGLARWARYWIKKYFLKQFGD